MDLTASEADIVFTLCVVGFPLWVIFWGFVFNAFKGISK